jgi:hypothetical protein
MRISRLLWMPLLLMALGLSPGQGSQAGASTTSRTSRGDRSSGRSPHKVLTHRAAVLPLLQPGEGNGTKVGGEGLTKAYVGRIARSALSGRSAQPFAHLPLSFERNEGQTDPNVRFLAHGPGYTLFLTGDGAVLALQRTSHPASRRSTPWRAPASSQESVVRLSLVGANPHVQAAGEKELPGKSNYFIGSNPSRWHTDVPIYARVYYRGVYPGVDVVYYGWQGTLENDFVVAPRSDPGQIRIRIAGAGRVRQSAAGDLVLKTRTGDVMLHVPVAYQVRGNQKQPVNVHYVRLRNDEFGLKATGYRRNEPLVIDPAVVYSTYLGGSGGDVGYGIAVDVNDNVFVCGVTNSTNFPTASAEQSSYGGSGDAFVSEINPTGTKLIYSTYLGGSGSDSASACALGTTDTLYVTGTTNSTDFPVAPTISPTSTTSAFQTAYGGNGDAFVAAIEQPGNKLLYSSYLGGSGADFGQGIAVDSSGNAYVTGSTQSPDFPVPNAEQPTIGGASDAFVTEVNLSGTSLVYSTYLGGSQADTGQAIKVDSSGDAYVAGYTFSTDFPTKNPTQTTNAGGSDGFVAELSASTTTAPTPSLLFSTYLGGGSNDEALGLALDKSGNIYVTGMTQSGSSAPFPTTSGAYQTLLKGTQNAFVTKFSAGTSPGTFCINCSGGYSTYLGGSVTDQGNGIAVDSSGDAFVVGYTQSSDFPSANPTQTTLGITGGSTCGTTPCADAFITEMNPTGSSPNFSTFLGGSGADFGQAIALDTSVNAFVTGSTASSNFPVTPAAYQGSLGGVPGNAFVAEIEQANAPSLTISPAKLNFGNEVLSVKSTAQTITVVNEGTSPLTISSITVGSTDFSETDDCVGTVTADGGTCTINVTFTPAAAGAVTSQITLTDNLSSSPQSITITGTGVTTASSVTLSPTSLTFASQATGTVSAPQTVTITNSGTSTVNITSISVTGDFSQTNTCAALNNVLAAGQSCMVSVVFAPTGSGALSGTLSVNDTATGSPQTAALGGTGTAEFSLTSSTPVVAVLIGDTSATFTVAASAQSGFTGSISLSCAGVSNCSFSPSAVVPGQTSTLTLSDLTASTTNPLNFSVQGASGSQSASVSLRLLLRTWTLSGSPQLNTIEAGSSASYTLLVTPEYGFNQAVELSCFAGLPSGTRCSFSPSTVTPNGSSPIATRLIITTTTESSAWPFETGGKRPPRWLLILAGAWLSLSVPLWLMARRREAHLQMTGAFSRVWLASRALVFGALLFALLLSASCRGVGAGAPTPSGNYIITVEGALQANTAVTVTTTVDLAVTPTT